MSWLHADLARPVVAPLQSTSATRSTEQLRAVIGQFEVRAPRYLKRDVDGNGTLETFCNFFTRDISEAMHAPLPRGMRANEMFDWLAGAEAKAAGWETTDEHTAQRAADEGLFAIACWKNPRGGPGHITPLIPSEGQPGTWVANVGANNFARGLLVRAFGGLKPSFFVHP